ncbi:1171_t:CDS:1 [Ambispora gerdemannii]|uniref:1171_t:CDS:1 n=1 Tax=Ambispora gerdemannii TaxID=144530 RepID=A0A9N9FBN6_9GLOM|nr:1171_t:CDS:1 [Ambispora gerdemannii]
MPKINAYEKASVSKSSLREIPLAKIILPFPPNLTPAEVFARKINGDYPSKAPNNFIIYRSAFVKEFNSKGIYPPMKVLSPIISKRWKEEPDFVKAYYSSLAFNATKLLSAAGDGFSNIDSNFYSKPTTKKIAFNNYSKIYNKKKAIEKGSLNSNNLAKEQEKEYRVTETTASVENLIFQEIHQQPHQQQFLIDHNLSNFDTIFNDASNFVHAHQPYEPNLQQNESPAENSLLITPIDYLPFYENFLQDLSPIPSNQSINTSPISTTFSLDEHRCPGLQELCNCSATSFSSAYNSL